jgi:hypothetical protein
MRCSNQSTYQHPQLWRIMGITGALVASSIQAGLYAQNPDPRYQTRKQSGQRQHCVSAGGAAGTLTVRTEIGSGCEI